VCHGGRLRYIVRCFANAERDCDCQFASCADIFGSGSGFANAERDCDCQFASCADVFGSGFANAERDCDC
jgi:hypothetical protein